MMLLVRLKSPFEVFLVLRKSILNIVKFAMPTTVTSLRNCRYLLAWILISLVALLFITGFLFTSSSLSLVDLELAGESSSALMGSSPLPGDQDYNELALLQSMVTMMRRKTVEAVQSSNSKDENAIINGVIMPKMGNTTVREEACTICMSII